MVVKCFLDIETEANPPALELLPTPSAPSNYKDPEKIAAYIASKQAEEAEKAALDSDLGKITAAAVRLGEDGKTHGWVVDESLTEQKLLKLLWYSINKANGQVVGYNVLGFDLPYIMRRTFALRCVMPPLFPYMRRYRTYPVTDLMQILSNWGATKYKSLKFICKRYQIENPLPDLDGSQYKDMDHETRLAYVKNDVDMVVMLYKKMRGYYPL